VARGANGEEVCMKVSGPQTVNRSELTAILAVLEALPPDEYISIYTDSKCSTHKITAWIADPTSLDGDKHADILRRIGHVLAERTADIFIRKVPAHCGVHWNEVVDKAAKKAARTPADQNLPPAAWTGHRSRTTLGRP
jgi:ribonuclease HI